jgi:formylglycine-generating enzyme required for sulfatase activity
MPFSDSVLDGFRRNQLRIVFLDEFEISVFPVTNEEYWQFVQDTGHPVPQHWRDRPYAWTGRPFLQKYAYHPVVHVQHRDAVAYCEWRGAKDTRRRYRLPTREEWEAAARGPEPRVYPWGDVFEASRCNAGESHWARTCDVRAYEPGDSPQGCRQMTGNVFEWLQDESGRRRFMRGGSFARSCEVFGMGFFEMETNDTYESGEAGFRIVRE